MREHASGCRVLIAAERVIADSLAAALTNDAYLVLTAYDGSSAFRLAQEFRPQALISNVLLPELCGVALAIRVRAALPTCKTLLFSSEPEPHPLVEDAWAAGYDFELLPVPIQPAVIIERVAQLMHEFPPPLAA